ncbi:MAG: nicotinate (nicotinamide) nucleotide adenylyltransferase [Lachnospiraceae bacterium]|nr:nicotinate (nicotinamide) nucleotide adenylyltransferase [Lachnospiraceae bacterium]
MKTGIFGGAFDPVHLGHIRLGSSAAREHHLERLILLPTGIPPHKAALSASAKDRVRLLKFAADNMSAELDIPVTVDEREVSGNVTNYTYVTLQGFHRDYPDDEFYFIMGGDSIEYFHSWVKPEVIASQAVLLAGRRKNVDEQVIKDLILDYAKRFNADVRLVGSPETDISSTKLREILKNLPYGMFSDYEAIKNSVEYKELLSEILKFMDEKSLVYIYENRVYDNI